MKSGTRVAIMAAVGAAVTLGVGVAGQWLYAPVVGWAVACLVYVAWVWLAIGGMDGQQTRRHATQEDPSRSLTHLLLTLAALASLVAVVFVFAGAKSSPELPKLLLASLGLSSVLLSWSLVHTLYTLRYAVLYYSADRERVIDFNQDAPPAYSDFAYLAFTVGMTFQVSDTNLRASPVRAVVWRHALVSYLFGAVILAAAVNLVAGLG